MSYLNSAPFAISRLVMDSRLVQTGDTFVACQGEYVDGRQFIADAITRGATSVLWDNDNFSWNSAWTVPQLAIPQLRWNLGHVAAEYFGQPSAQQWVCGITGTNGKTSCSQWLAQVLDHAGKRCAVIGTVGNGFMGELEHTTHTTPDALTVQGLLARYLKLGASHVAMEVSSHGLQQGRVNGTQIDVAVLTNLTRDHLDYHGTMESYAQAKERLFSWPDLNAAVLNADDVITPQWLAEQKIKAGRVLQYGFSDHADIRATRIEMGAHGLSLDLATPWGELELSGVLIGRFNAYNLMAVATAALLAGLSPEQVMAATPHIKPASGRTQTLGGGDLPLVVVDYAHTPDALEKVIAALRELVPAGKKLYVVFGCGGDRDPGKRPLMGAAVSRGADVAVITSDNPRNENPLTIIEAIKTGMSGEYRVEADRAEAIRLALGEAQIGDVVLIAGKGHENYQEVSGVKLPFSDLELAQEVLGG